MKLSNYYPLLQEGVSPVDCPFCSKECYPVERKGDIIIYSNHTCKRKRVKYVNKQFYTDLFQRTHELIKSQKAKQQWEEKK